MPVNRNLVWVLLGALFSLLLTSSSSPAHASAHQISSTFLNLVAAGTVHRHDGDLYPSDWTAWKWNKQFSDAQVAGINTITIQSSLYREPATGNIYSAFPSSIAGVMPLRNAGGAIVDLVEQAFESAQRFGMHVRLGLFQDEGSWNISGLPASDDAALTEQLFDELEARYASRFPVVLDGWYLPGEANVNSIQCNSCLSGYYRAVVDFIHDASTSPSVMISPYANPLAGEPPQHRQSLWSAVLSVAPIDIIAPQDSSAEYFHFGGRRDLYVGELKQWFAAVHAAIQATHATTLLWGNIELYTLQSKYPTIADLDQTRRSLLEYVSAYTCFSFFNHVAPWTLGTDTVAREFQAWNLGV